MAYEITSTAARLLGQLRDVVQAVDDSVLAPASVEARAEWQGLVRRLSSDADAGRGPRGDLRGRARLAASEGHPVSRHIARRERADLRRGLHAGGRAAPSDVDVAGALLTAGRPRPFFTRGLARCVCRAVSRQAEVSSGYPFGSAAMRFFISSGETSSTWVASVQRCPNGSSTTALRSP